MSEYKAMTLKNPTETENLYPAPVQIIMNTCGDNRKKETTKRARYSSGWNSSYQMHNKLCHKEWKIGMTFLILLATKLS